MTDYGNDLHLASLTPEFQRFQAIIQAGVIIDVETGCWLWAGRKAKIKKRPPLNRYGQVWVDNRVMFAHRLSYIAHVGPLADGLYACHKCDTPACCNPRHLFAGTQTDNMRDSRDKGRHPNASKTHCVRGHPFSGDNLIVRSGGRRRVCRTCYKRVERSRIRIGRKRKSRAKVSA